MVTIYADYGDEPKDEFLPLPENLGCYLYGLEMDGFSDDISFFANLLPDRGRILELGCGTGRIAGSLADQRRPVVGVDISLAMLQAARQKQHPHCSYLGMDMTRVAFTTRFDHIIIGYNTLNLLCAKESIVACLRGCGKHLLPGGTLLLQLFLPARDFITNNKKIFQFQIFDRPGGGQVIKEILKHYSPSTKTVHVEERYRIRPMTRAKANEDYRTTYPIGGFSAAEWYALLEEANFTPSEVYGGYDGEPFYGETSPMLLGAFSFLK